MELDDIIEQLNEIHEEQPFPYEAVEAAVQQREAITPVLLQSLDGVYQAVTTANDYEEAYEKALDLHNYAMFLLAQFREQQAFPKLLRLLTLGEDDLDFVMSDTLTEDMPSLLYSTYGGDLDALKAVILCKGHYSFARGAALKTMTALCRDGRISRDSMAAFLRVQIGDPELTSDCFPDFLVDAVVELKLFELVEDVRSLYRRELTDPQSRGDFADVLDDLYEYDRHEDRCHVITDAAKEMEWWACFDSSGRRNRPLSPTELQERIRTTGRNDPCPCGSGKKYKKCCRPKDEERLLALSKALSRDFEDTLRWNYPPIASTGTGRPGLSAHFSRDAIWVDEPARTGCVLIHHSRGDRGKVKKGLAELAQAYERFVALCDREGIGTLAGFDERYQVHYACEEWLDALIQVLEENGDDWACEVRQMVERMR